ncbi:uncharacterized protein PRCAT00005822001 [Priceomyces carsonii]|uniref:uncharacterized protein n=1 Tax=Priceomyces carsonii TaxID=28549 RepID=UPI002ED87667|nr:unnamed protein product [Priceomyces carsonii]
MAYKLDQTFQDREIVVLGAGIIGCAITRTLLQKGFKVTTVAKHLPGDTDIWYASNWAGALWHGGRSLPNDDQRYMQAVSYRQFMSDARTDPKCGVCVIGVEEFFEKRPDTLEQLWYSGVNPKFRDMDKCKYEDKQFEYGCEYETVSIEPPRYLHFLKNEIQKLGGNFIRKEIKSVDELYIDFPNTIIFINASGVGPKYIEGLYDENSFPNRGQNVLVKTKTDKAFSRNGNEYTYVIPRPLQGVVVCGGVNQENQTHSNIDKAIVEDELRRANKLAPDVVSEDPDIAGYIVGIRPARKGGFRLEKEKVKENKFILHAYGFNGGGYSFSYGAAQVLERMVEDLEQEFCVNPRLLEVKTAYLDKRSPVRL